MMARLRTLKVLAVLLYIGPLFAGAAGQGISSIPPFVAIFVVWLIVLRPEQWPASAEEWSTLPAWGAAMTIVLSQTALVCVLFALGRGVGAVAGLEFVFDPLLPLAVSFVSIPICRMLWNSGEAAMAGVYLDDEARAAHAPRAASLAAASIVPLLNLPDDFAHSLATDAVNMVMEPAGSDLRLKALVAALSNPDRSHASLRRSVMLWATEPEIVAPGTIPGVMASAFDITGRDLDLMRLYVPRALALIAAFPDRAEDFPSPESLRKTTEEAVLNNPQHDLPADLRADLREGLLALARAVEAALQKLSLAS